MAGDGSGWGVVRRSMKHSRARSSAALLGDWVMDDAWFGGGYVCVGVSVVVLTCGPASQTAKPRTE